MSKINRCIGINKNKKKCRKKLNKNQEYYCCNSHKPLNLNDEGLVECFCCCEDIKPNDLWHLKCGHAFHKSCFSIWLNKFTENKDSSEYIHENELQCPLCRKNIYKKDSNQLKKLKYNKSDNYYHSKIIDLCVYGTNGIKYS